MFLQFFFSKKLVVTYKNSFKCQIQFFFSFVTDLSLGPIKVLNYFKTRPQQFNLLKLRIKIAQSLHLREIWILM